MQQAITKLNQRIADASHAAITDYIAKHREHGATEEDFSEALGIPMGTFTWYICGHRTIPAWVVVAIAEKTGDCRALEAMSNAAGCPKIVTAGAAMARTLHTIESNTSALVDCTAALSDGRIDTAECKRCLPKLQKAMGDIRQVAENIQALHGAPLSMKGQAI